MSYYFYARRWKEAIQDRLNRWGWLARRDGGYSYRAKYGHGGEKCVVI